VVPPNHSRTLASIIQATNLNQHYGEGDCMSDAGGKIQIDDDWKSQAAAEKERLAQTTADSSPRDAGAADFSSLVQLLAMQVVVGLGGMMGPGGQEIPPNMEIAKHHIDLLDILDSKTKNNLDKNERAMLDTTLHQLRLAYVETVRAMSEGSPAGPL
jgi:hypothetical protein